MKSILIKDFYVIIKQLKIFLVMIPLMAFMGGLYMSTFAILIASVLPMTAMSYDERCKWKELASMMPYSKKDLVISKYLLGYICTLAGSVLVFLGQYAISIFSNKIDVLNPTIILLSMCIALILMAINTPILFKLGTEKGRIVFIGVMALVGASSAFLGTTTTTIPEFLPLTIVIVTIVLNCISIFITMKIKANE